MMRFLLLLFFFSTLFFASEIQELSTTKQEIIKLKQKQVHEKEQVNKYDWLSNITASGSVSKDDDSIKTEDYSLSISQDIFRFGGITSQIEYSKELAKMELLGINKDAKSDLNTLYTTLIDIKLGEINLQQNLLKIDNASIDLKHKTSEYKEGQVGISDLNDAIMKKNELQDSRKELNLSLETSINTLQKYTTKKYQEITIPKVKLISKNLFVQNILSVRYAKATNNVDSSLYKIKKTDYLPKVSLNGSVGYGEKQHVSDDYYNYGVKISMPLSYSATNDIERARLEYLISEQELNDAKEDARISYESVMLKIKNYEDRISLAHDDVKLYTELLKMNTQEYKAGFKTIDDVKSLENSMNMRQLDIKSYELNIQKQLLNLYFQM